MKHPHTAMDTQAQVERQLVDEITEEQFLKELYMFMRKRDTPIERIPHLGFKQIDLFVMFKTVEDLGGYHQVTTQQLWKQVYNRLGGNPRSTSAATCTRRHYEKLLLPFECHKKGMVISALPLHQPKPLHSANFDKDGEDGLRPAKRKLLSVPLQQSAPPLQSDAHGNIFPMPLHYTHYYQPNPAVLPPYVPMSSSMLTLQSPPSPKSHFPFCPPRQNPTDRVKEPLEHLRHLAEQYKTSSGLAEPLNLSVKAQHQEANRNPASSFAPPSSSKNPKFLNQPSPLYTPHRPPVVRNEGSEAQDGNADITLCSYPVKEGEAYMIDVEAVTACSPKSESSLIIDDGITTMAQKPKPLETDCSIWPKEKSLGSPEVGGLNLSYALPGLPQDKEGKMEIQIPLSMLHSWLRLCGSSALINGAKQLQALPTLETRPEQSGCSDPDILPTDLSLHCDPHHWSPAAEDMRRQRQRTAPSPKPTIETNSKSQNHFTAYKPLPSGSILKNASGRDVYPVKQQNTTPSYSSNIPQRWDTYDKVIRTTNIPKSESSPITVLQEFTTKSLYQDTPRGGKEWSELPPSASLMVNSSPLLHLTTEEVMKLKKMISSSS